MDSIRYSSTNQSLGGAKSLFRPGAHPGTGADSKDSRTYAGMGIAQRFLLVILQIVRREKGEPCDGPPIYQV